MEVGDLVRCDEKCKGCRIVGIHIRTGRVRLSCAPKMLNWPNRLTLIVPIPQEVQELIDDYNIDCAG